MMKNQRTAFFRLQSFVLALPIFPGRLQPSIVGRSELNFRVRDGNGWTLALISTNYLHPLSREQIVLYGFACALSSTLLSKALALYNRGDPYRIRTDVKGVRGLCLNHLTNGPPIYLKQLVLIRSGTPSGTRTLDTLIKSQVLYQLS